MVEDPRRTGANQDGSVYAPLEVGIANPLGGNEMVVDGILRIDTHNGLMRITLATVRGDPGQGKEPLHIVVPGRLVMALNVADDFRMKLAHALIRAQQHTNKADRI